MDFSARILWFVALIQAQEPNIWNDLNMVFGMIL